MGWGEWCWSQHFLELRIFFFFYYFLLLLFARIQFGFYYKIDQKHIFWEKKRGGQRAAFDADCLGKTGSGKEPVVVEPSGVPGVEGTGWTGNLGGGTEVPEAGMRGREAWEGREAGSQLRAPSASPSSTSWPQAAPRSHPRAGQSAPKEVSFTGRYMASSQGLT